MRLNDVIDLANAYATDDEYDSALNKKLWKNIHRWLKELKKLRAEKGKINYDAFQLNERVAKELVSSKTCPTCDGIGCFGSGSTECPTCDGSGKVKR